MPAVRVKGLKKVYGSQRAVDDISFVAEDGRLTTLLGPSGSGKSTVIRMIAGLEQPSAGEIWIGEEPVFLDGEGERVPAEKRNIGMVFQSYALWPHKTIFDNIAFPLRVRKMPRETIGKRVAEALQIVNLQGYASRYPGQLSGGEQQRVALARALVYRPQILLLDEPLANLDALIRERVRFELLEIQKKVGITTIYVTHDQAEAMVISDVMIILNEGRYIQAGAPKEVFDHPKTPFVASFLGVNNLIAARWVAPGSAVTEDGKKLHWLPTPEMPESWESGREILLAIRPHQIRMHRKPSSAATELPGTVTKRAYVGVLTEYWVESGSQTLRVQSQADEGFQVGDSVWLVLDSPSLRMIPSPRRGNS